MDQPDLIAAVGSLPLHHCSPLSDLPPFFYVQVFAAERSQVPPVGCVLARCDLLQMPILRLFEFGVGSSQVGAVVGVVVGDVIDGLRSVEVDHYFATVLLDYLESHELVGVVYGLLDVELVGVVVGHERAGGVPAGTDAVGHTCLRESVVRLVLLGVQTGVLALRVGDVGVGVLALRVGDVGVGVLTLGVRNVGIFAELFSFVRLDNGFIISWSDYPYLVESASEMLLNDGSVIVGVAFVDFQSLTAEGADVAALSSPHALSDGHNLEEVASMLAELSHFDVRSIRTAFRHHMQGSLAAQTFKQAESVVRPDVEPLILVSIVVVEKELVAVEEVGGYFCNFGDVQGGYEFVGGVGVGQEVVVVVVVMVGETLVRVVGSCLRPNHEDMIQMIQWGDVIYYQMVMIVMLHGSGYMIENRPYFCRRQDYNKEAARLRCLK